MRILSCLNEDLLSSQEGLNPLELAASHFINYHLKKSRAPLPITFLIEVLILSPKNRTCSVETKAIAGLYTSD
jgi:hypothetical protein